MRALTLLVCVLAACSGKKAATTNDCDAAVQRGVDVTIAKRRAGVTAPMTPAEEAVPAKLKAALTKACTDDKWSKEVLDCFKTAEDIATCKAMLTPEQRANYTKTAMGVMMGAGGGSGAMPPHGMGGGGGMGGGMGSGVTPGLSTGGTPGGVLPAACQAYAEYMDQVARCASLPQNQKDALKNTYDAMASTFRDAAKMEPAMQEKFNQTCANALEQTKEAAKSCGIP